jgi:superkiller protein 3
VLYRAQTLDPDHAAAWIGQALVASANNHDTEANAMFEHAVGLTANVVRRHTIYLYVSLH